MAPKLVLFNGPRHSGKDTAAAKCVERFNALHFKMSGPIKAAIKATFSLTDENVEYLESIKTEPCDLLFGKSYVDVQITFSEKWGKKQFGEQFFGNLAVRHVRQLLAGDQRPSPLVVCSDSGFSHEAKSLLNTIFDVEDVLLIRLHRPDKSFDGDSRGYIKLDDVATIEVCNDGNIDLFHKRIVDVVSVFAE